jgi:hypothetical protein
MINKANVEKPPMEGKVKLFNNATREAVIIAAGEMVNYDVRLWQVIDGEVKNRAIRLEDVEAMRQKKKSGDNGG